MKDLKQWTMIEFVPETGLKTHITRECDLDRVLEDLSERYKFSLSGDDIVWSTSVVDTCDLDAISLSFFFPIEKMHPIQFKIDDFHFRLTARSAEKVFERIRRGRERVSLHKVYGFGRCIVLPMELWNKVIEKIEPLCSLGELEYDISMNFLEQFEVIR